MLKVNLGRTNKQNKYLDGGDDDDRIIEIMKVGCYLISLTHSLIHSIIVEKENGIPKFLIKID